MEISLILSEPTAGSRAGARGAYGRGAGQGRLVRAIRMSLMTSMLDERFAFHDAAGTPDVCLTIATGDQRIYANLLLTIGVVQG